MNDLTDRDASNLRDMLENARLALHFMRGKSRVDLADDKLLAYAVVRALEIIGEAANRVAPETRSHVPDVDWIDIIGMRNRIVHGYDNINYDIVWNVIQSNLAPLIEILLPILQDFYPDLAE